MEGKSIVYYKESGIAPPLNIIFTITVSTFIMIPLSYFFSLIITFMPFIYINLILVILYGYALSLIVNFISKVFKIRNKKKKTLIALITCLFSIYAQWISYFYIITSENISLFFNLKTYFNMFIRPDYLVFNIIELSKYGTWEIFSIIFKGSTLWIIWILEFLLIMLSAYLGITKIKNPPFSESNNNWYHKYTFSNDFEPIKLKNKFIEEYEKNPFEAICSLGKSDFSRYSKIYVYSSDSETKNLISIDNILITENGKGKKEYTEILAPHFIDNNYMIQLKQKFKLKKASFFDFFNDLYS